MKNIETEYSLADLLLLLLKGWKIIVLFAIIGFAGGYLLSRWKLPVFEVDSLIEIETDEGGGIYSKNMGELQDVFGAVSKAETESEILMSRKVLAPVVDTLHLNYFTTPASKYKRLFGSVGTARFSELYLPNVSKNDKFPWILVCKDSSLMTLVSPKGDSLVQVPIKQRIAVPYEDDSVVITLEEFTASPREAFILHAADPVDFVYQLIRKLSVEEKGKKTGILELRYVDQYPEIAANTLNEIMRSYLRQNIDAKSAEAQKTLTFLKQQLPAVKSKLDSADSALNAYRVSRSTVDLSAEAKVTLEQQVQYGQQLLELQQHKQELTRLYEETHPQVAAVNNQIARIKNAINLSSKKAKHLPQTQQEVLKLTRDVTVATEFYQTVTDKIQQLEVVRAGEVGSARIIDTALIPGSPIKPNRRLIVMVGLIVGIAFGFSILILLSVFNKGLSDVAQIEKIAECSIFAQIPRSFIEEKTKNNAKNSNLLALVSKDDLAIEGIRSLRTALEFSLLCQGGKVLGISGLTPGVGKSFLSSNLSALFSSAGRNVLLIDADLRKGRIHEQFGMERINGLSDLLLQKRKVDDVIKTIKEISGLSIITTGKLPPNPSEMLASVQFENLLNELKPKYDLIIIDTSPVLLVTDPLLVLRYSDFASIVLEYGKHTGAEIAEAMSKIRRHHNLSTCIVLNKCQDAIAGYGRYTKYGKYTNTKSEN